MRMIRRLIHCFLWRRVEVTGHELVVARGPLVIISRSADFFLSPSRLPRELDAVYVVDGQTEESFAAYSFGLTGWLVSKGATSRFGDMLQQKLEAGAAIGLIVSKSETMDFVAQNLVEIELSNAGKLGITVLGVKSIVSKYISIRRDLWLKLQKLAWTYSDLIKAKESVAAKNEYFAALAYRMNQMSETVTTVMEHNEHDLVLEQLRRLYKLDLGDEMTADDSEILRQLPTLNDIIDSAADKKTWNEIARQTRQLFFFFHNLDVRDRTLRVHANLDLVRKKLRKSLVIHASLIPLGLLGIINHYAIYRAPQWLTYWTDSETSSPKTIRLICLPIFYLLQTWIVSSMFGTMIGVGYLLCLPLSALFAAIAIENRLLVWDNWALLKFLKQSASLHKELLNLRWDILDKVKKFKNLSRDLK